jgi:acetate---CoA ligase (ADP-forming) subunit beta
MSIIESAIQEGRSALSEIESKSILRGHGIPVAREILAYGEEGFATAIREIGFPLVLKGCSPTLSHKTERGLVRVDIRNEQEAKSAFNEILEEVKAEGGGVLIQQMVRGSRELAVGLVRDPQFGPCVMFGLGGIFSEILHDVSFRVAPLERQDAFDMMEEIRSKRILDSVRGMPAADKDELADILIEVGEIGLKEDRIQEIDINPLILVGGKPVAVDGLVILRRSNE